MQVLRLRGPGSNLSAPKKIRQGGKRIVNSAPSNPTPTSKDTTARTRTRKEERMAHKKATRSPATGGACPQLTALLLAGIIIGQAKGALHEVNGIVGGAALLYVMVPRNVPVIEVRWKFGPTKNLLGLSKAKIFEPFSNTNYSQLIQRLDMYNETTLRVRNLTKRDSGVYKADALFKDGDTHEEEFQLKVYDPVPDPQIERTSLNYTSDGCNVTLACQVPKEQDLRIHWFKENICDSTRLNISDGRLLQVSLKTNKSSCVDSKYICVVSNPVDKKNHSTVVDCSVDTNSSPRVKSGVFIAIALVLIIVFLVCVLYYLTKKKRKDEACTKVEPQETWSSDILYADIDLVNPEGNDQCPGSKAQRPIVLRTQTSKPTIYNEICVP